MKLLFFLFILTITSCCTDYRTHTTTDNQVLVTCQDYITGYETGDTVMLYLSMGRWYVWTGPKYHQDTCLEIYENQVCYKQAVIDSIYK